MRVTGKGALVALVLVSLAAGGAWIHVKQNDSPVAAKLASIVQKPKPTVIGWPAAVLAFAGDGNAGFADGAAAKARFADPFGLVMDREGNVYVADAGDNNRIRKIAPDGMVSTLAGGAEGFANGAGAAASFNTPSGLAIDKAGNLYVADTGNNAVRKVTPQGVVTTLAGTGVAGFADGEAAQARFNGPVGVAVDAAGNVFVADSYNDRIRKIGIDGKVTTIAGLDAPGYADGDATLAQFDTPTGIAVDAKGVLVVADTKNGAIRSIDSAGVVTTLAKAPDDEKKPLLRRPVSVALAHDGVIYIGDQSRGRLLQLTPDGAIHGLSGIGIDIDIGDSVSPRFDRPSAIAIDRKGALLVADAGKRFVRKVAPKAPDQVLAQAAVPPPPEKPDSFPWPFKPQNAWHEVVGTIGEVRGSYDGENRDHFHSGLDVQADMGVPVLAVANEKISDPLPNWGYGGTGEGMALDRMAYIHMRVGRTIKDEAIDPARFTLYVGEKGKPVRVRVKRGTRFQVGDTLGTVNRMFHVHLVLRTPGGEANPLLLPFPGFEDTIAPRVDGIYLVGADGKRLVKGKKDKRLKVARDAGPLAIVVDAWDQMDGNEKRRRLGLHEAGYQLLDAKGEPLPGFEKPLVNIEFNRLPPDPESVKVAYSNESGITVYGSKATKFLYVVTNTVRDGMAKEGSWNPAPLAPGDYIIRVHAADYTGNTAQRGRDLAITVE
jgi:sugar lactone lactonase YvrE